MNFSLQSEQAGTASPVGGAPPSLAWDLPAKPRGAVPAVAATPPPQAPAPSRRPERGERKKKKVGLGPKLVATGVVLTGLGSALYFTVGRSSNLFAGMFGGSRTDVIAMTVQEGPLEVVVKEKGTLESSNNIEVRCEVEGGTTIIKIEPEGQRVKKGQVVCELDSAALRDQLANQKITTDQAEASFKQAELNRQVAEIAVEEYQKGTLDQELKTIEGEIALAESDQTRAEDRVKWTKRMLAKGYVSKSQLIAEERNLQNTKFQFQTANMKRKVLKEFTAPKTVKEKESEVKKYLADELSKSSALEIEKDKLKKLEVQIQNCMLIAPADGLVVYCNETGGRGGQEVIIEEGTQVRQRQPIFKLPDVDNMRVNTKIHESMVDRVRKGLKSKVQVDAFPNQILDGTVESVAVLADPSNWLSSEVKLYTSFVKIDRAPAGLRPGMSANVTILVDRIDSCVSVPAQAILPFEGKDTVYVLSEGGNGERREIDLGTANDQVVEIRKGLKAGERIALNPSAFLTQEEKQQLLRVSNRARPGAKDFGAEAGAIAADAKAEDAKKGAEGGESKKGMRKGGRGGMGMDPAAMEKFKNATPEEREKMKAEFMSKMGGGAGGIDPAVIERLKNATPEEREKMKAEFQSKFGGGGGPGGPGGGGGGGFGGGGPRQ